MSHSTRICTISDCQLVHYGKGLCRGHYQQRRNGRPIGPFGGSALTYGMSDRERFEYYVDRSGSCHIWKGAKIEHGYGAFRFDGRKQPSHRVSYILENGPIPTGMQIDHMCHNPPCVNAAHLRPATRKQNMENRSGPTIASTTGVRGVYLVKSTGKWAAVVGHGGKRYYVGSFSTLDEAEAAVTAKRNELFTHNILDRSISAKEASPLQAGIQLNKLINTALGL